MRGRIVSAETEARISAAKKGRRVPWSEKRRAVGTRGGWRHSEETRARLRASALKRGISSETRAKMIAAPRAPLSPERRAELAAAMSARMKGKPKSPEHIANAAAAQRGRKRGPLSAGHRAMMSTFLTGKPRSPETRRKIREASLGSQSHVFGQPQTNPKGRGRRTLYRGISFRSSYEARFAKALDTRGVAWEYEPRRFDLGDCTYLPDFYVPEMGAYWEVKGWLTSERAKRIGRFRKLHPEIPLVVATKEVILMMEAA